MARKTALAAGTVLVAATLVVAALAATGAIPGIASAAQHDGESSRTITVSANGQAGAEPDKAVIRIEVESRAEDATVARKQVAENVSNIRSALTDMGLSEDQIRTVDFNIYRDREPPRREGERPPVTYRASHSLTIEVDETDRVGPVIDTAIDNGATNIFDVEFTLSETTRQALRKEALADAMGDARGQARTIASSADMTVTGVGSVSTTDIDGPIVRREYALAAGGAGGGGTDINTGPVTVRATVTVTYNASG